MKVEDESRGTELLLTWRRLGVSAATHGGMLKAGVRWLRAVAAVMSIVKFRYCFFSETSCIWVRRWSYRRVASGSRHGKAA